MLACDVWGVRVARERSELVRRGASGRAGSEVEVEEGGISEGEKKGSQEVVVEAGRGRSRSFMEKEVVDERIGGKEAWHCGEFGIGRRFLEWGRRLDAGGIYFS